MKERIDPTIKSAFDKACAVERVTLETIEDLDSGKCHEFRFTVQGIGPRNIGVIDIKGYENQSLDEIAATAGMYAGAWARRRILEQERT